MSTKFGHVRGGAPAVSHIWHRRNNGCGAGHSVTIADTGDSSADMEKIKSNHTNDDRWDVHPILYTHSSGSGISGRGDNTCRPLISRRTCYVMVNQLCLKCTLTLHWQAQLKGAANRPGMHPVTIPLPTTVEVSRWLASLMIGSGKYTTMLRLLKYTSGLVTLIPANLPRLVDSGWSTLGEETPTMKNMNRMMRSGRGRRLEAPPRPLSMEDLTTNRVGTGAVYEPLR